MKKYQIRWFVARSETPLWPCLICFWFRALLLDLWRQQMKANQLLLHVWDIQLRFLSPDFILPYTQLLQALGSEPTPPSFFPFSLHLCLCYFAVQINLFRKINDIMRQVKMKTLIIKTCGTQWSHGKMGSYNFETILY